MTRTLHIESAEALAAIANECEGFAEVYRDDGDTEDEGACIAAAAWVSALTEAPPFAVHIPEEHRHTINDAVANLADRDGPREPGAWWSFEAITDDANRRALFDAAEGWKRSSQIRASLVEAFNALQTVGASPAALLDLCDLLGQRGCDGGDGEPMCGARDDFLTSVCDVVISG